MVEKFPFVVGLLAIPLFFGGCHSAKIKTWPVTGTVTLDGQALDDGMIRFHPQNDTSGRYAYGAVRNGVFTLQTLGGNFGGGAVDGEYVVTFSRLLVPPNVPARRNGRNSEIQEAVESLPSAYTEEAQTPFSATVLKRKNIFDFELKSSL